MLRKSFLSQAAVAAVIVASALLRQTGAAAQGNAPAERFVANAVNISEVGRTGATIVDIVVQRWSTEAERQRLVATLLDKGPDALLKALQDTRKVGYIRTPTSLGWDLRFAWQTPADEGGRRIVLATDRPISLWEAVNRPRTIDYPFTVVEIRLNRDGTGEGKISLLTRITGNKRTNTIELENYATQPVMLTEVKKAK